MIKDPPRAVRALLGRSRRPGTTTASGYLAHEPDLAWITALWAAIHDSPSGPVQARGPVIALLTSRIAQRGLPVLGKAALEQRLETLFGAGISLRDGPPPPSPGAVVIRRRSSGTGTYHCFHFKDGSSICVEHRVSQSLAHGVSKTTLPSGCSAVFPPRAGAAIETPSGPRTGLATGRR